MTTVLSPSSLSVHRFRADLATRTTVSRNERLSSTLTSRIRSTVSEVYFPARLLRPATVERGP
jgi:hypothetical protein